jgi:cardiolipin synthase A/B
MSKLVELWPYFATAATVLISLTAAGHAVLYKRDSRAAIGWVGIIWLAPIVGTLLYVTLGVNRIHRRASALRGGQPRPMTVFDPARCTDEMLARTLGSDGAHLASLVRLGGDVVRRPLSHGNRIMPLRNGDGAYPAMLAAIDGAARSVTLSTYIFDNDRAGQLFLDALSRAVERNVEVRVLIDDVGSRYKFPSIIRRLRRAGVPVARFIPTLVPWRFRYTNLRNHRKILVVDGRTGFTGGINIREGSLLELNPRHPVRDLHFRLDGPVVSQLQDVFVADWAFCTEEILEGEPWFAAIEPDGPVLARGIPDGPDDDFDKLRTVILGAIACARSSLYIVTPYFLPDASLTTALTVAALRGVDVNIVVPEKNNLALVQWASQAMWWQLLERGCRMWLSPPPFDHTKLMLVDDVWTLLGSANWDPRSLRLNFEFNVECYDRELTGCLVEQVTTTIGAARSVTFEDVERRPLPVKLRDGIARLASPYL